MSPHMRRRTLLSGLAAAGIGGVGIAAGASAVPGGTGTAGTKAEPDFGPNVSVFGPETPAAEIQARLDEVFGAQEEAQFGPGRHALLFKPGTYENGLGLATLVPAEGKAAMTVADVDGVKLAGFLVDAGEGGSPTLMEIGPEGADADHAADPTSLHDVFFRIGGPHAAQAATSLVVHSNHVIGDHTWLWRGDHGDGIGWETNPADTGLVVHGDDVTFYGLFAEHYRKYQVEWHGERGRTYFSQNEMPYDPPDQGAWMNGDTRGFAAYKVADGVRDHEAWGMGSYCFFTVNPSVTADRAFEVPDTAGVKLHHMVAVSLGGGTGSIQHLVNGTGGPADKANPVAYLTEYGS